ncbi:MAG: DUF4201 domain-containing protein [Thiocapsa sp.]|uniref:coiled-coil domain-containing protein n=1 Tax=Thiocapsa sp. TaxID=2024551 RepID=UPI001BCAA1DB|nr:DUF4201 domain-containing protein [Thiocapsa sp.]QVL50254.1 MAG: DUF4201 domain-containing protein [Thiocapsa sp.]
MRIVTILISGALLVGCCTNVTQDPSQGGLAGGVCGLTTGAYDQRIDEREARLAQVQGERYVAVQRQEDLKVNDAQSRRELSNMKSQVSRLQGQISSVTVSTTNKKGQKAELSQRANNLQAELNRLQGQPPVSQDYERRKAELEDEIANLWTIVNTL